MSVIEALCSDYLLSRLRLDEFIARLEPALGDFEIITRDDSEFINSIINRLEEIAFTVPRNHQIDSIRELIPKILKYASEKSDSL